MGDWAALVALGVYHGLNPATGWLFAVAFALQEQDARAVWRALVPVTAGHAASLLAVAAVVLLGWAVLPLAFLRWGCAGALVLVGAWRLSRYARHPRWVGMRASGQDLVVWSFLMATSHGAGLMLAPFLLHLSASHHVPAGVGVPWVLALGVHTAAMLGTMSALSHLVYRRLGVGVLRWGWINFDLVWAIALIATGTATLLFRWPET
jgi:hypothetical protein